MTSSWLRQRWARAGERSSHLCYQPTRHPPAYHTRHECTLARRSHLEQRGKMMSGRVATVAPRARSPQRAGRHPTRHRHPGSSRRPAQCAMAQPGPALRRPSCSFSSRYCAPGSEGGALSKWFGGVSCSKMSVGGPWWGGGFWPPNRHFPRTTGVKQKHKQANKGGRGGCCGQWPPNRHFRA